MRQKFPAYSFVHICKDMPSWMKHFDSDFDGIVKGTYSQIFGKKDINSYEICKIEQGLVVECIAWYEESQLSLLEQQNYILAQEMCEDFIFDPPKKEVSWDNKSCGFVFKYKKG